MGRTINLKLNENNFCTKKLICSVLLNFHVPSHVDNGRLAKLDDML